MKKIIIFLICIVFSILLFLFFCCSRKPDFVFSLNNPEKKVEIYILDAGATSARYAKFKVFNVDEDYSFLTKQPLDLFSLQMNKTKDTLYAIFGFYSSDYKIFNGDTVKIRLK